MTETPESAVTDNPRTAKTPEGPSERDLSAQGETVILRIEDVLSDPDGETLFLPSGEALAPLFQEAPAPLGPLVHRHDL